MNSHFGRLCWCRHLGAMRLAMGVMVVGLLISGCSKEKLEEMAAAVKDQAKTVQEKAMDVQQQARDMAASTPLADILPTSGRSEIGLASPIELSSGYVRLYTIADGRPSVVQFTSYDPEQGPNVYPALLVRAKVDATATRMLVGEVVGAEVYLQTAADSAVMLSNPAANLVLEISESDPQTKRLKGTIGNTTLVDSKGVNHPVNQIVVEGILP